jgi:VWFA-related protein
VHENTVTGNGARLRRLVAIFSVIAPVMVLGQAPSPQQQSSGEPQNPVTVRSTTRLVQVSVVVHDKKGEPVADLKKEDFTITEKGKPQDIAFFAVESAGRLPGNPPKLPPNVYSNRLVEKQGVPGSVTVILFDALNTKWSDQAYARQQVIKFLQQLQPEDRVAIYLLGRGLRVLHDYTTDSTALLAALGRFHGEHLPDLAASEPSPDAVQDNSTNPIAFGLDFLQPSNAEQEFFTTNRVLNTLAALKAIASHLANVPGRKNLIWVSGGFPLDYGFDQEPDPRRADFRRTYYDETEAAVRAVNNAGISIYPVDARGLIIGRDAMTADMQSGPVNPRQPPRARLGPTVPNLDTMRLLADRTGGRAAYNTNDLKNAIRNAVDDSKVTYMLAYYPAENAQDGKFHDIKIKVGRSGVNVRYRKGYFALPDVAQNDKTRKSDLSTAVWSPVDATSVGLNGRVDFPNSPDQNAMAVYAQIDPLGITLEQNGDRWQGKIDLLFIQRDDQGHEYTGATDTITLNLLKDNYMKVVRSGIVYKKDLQRDPKATNLRIVVRDGMTGAMGSLTIAYRDLLLRNGQHIDVPQPGAKPLRPRQAR